MKKNISDENLDKMLENLYNSEVSEKFEFKSNYITNKTEYNPEITVSGSEKHINKTFSPAKLTAIAAAALIMVSIGTYGLSSNTEFSAPSSQLSDTAVNNISEPAETTAENISENIETAETSMENTYENQTIDKEYILNHMLNSVDFFDTVEGEFVTYETGTETNVAFAVNFSDNLSERFAFEEFCSDSIYDNKLSCENFCSDKFEYSNNNGDIYYSDNIIITADEYIPASDRMYIDENGDNNWIYRNNMNMAYAKQCFMYQELIFSRLYDTSLWEITDEVNMFGYDGLVLEGETNSANKFTITVEKNSGIILDYKEYTGDELTSYIEVKNISIDNGLSVDKAGLEEHYKNLADKFCFADLAEMDEETINSYIELFGDALQRTDTGFTLCSYCLEQNGFDLSNIKLYGDCDFTMSLDEFYENADSEDKGYGVCTADGKIYYEVMLPYGEEHIKPELNYEKFKVNIMSDNYNLIVHYPNNQPLTDGEKEINEKFHNKPWAELIINK